MVNHIAGEHWWADEECQHGPFVSTEDDKTYLDKNSKALEAIQKVVMDPKILKSLGHNVTFR